MLELLYVIIVLWCYYSAYLVSRYSTAIFIDPDEFETVLPQVPRPRRNLLMKLVRDPRAFVQIAIIYKSFTLIVLTVIMVLIARPLAASFGIGTGVVGVWLLFFNWLFYLIVVEYLPRRGSRKPLNRQMVKDLWLITFIWILFSPIVQLYRKALQRANEGEEVTEEEKDEIVERAIETLAEQAGIGEAIVEEDEKEMIGQIFQLDQTVVREIMIPRIDITGIEKSTSFLGIRKLVLEDGHSRYPVYEGSIDKIIGIVYVKDLFAKMPEPGEKFDITKYLRKPYFVPETKVIGELLSEFKARHLHIALVVDEYGGVAGLVTLEDIIEEIFGEIQDEHDWEEAEIVKLPDGKYRVSAGLLVEKLQEYLDTDYEQGDYDTVGGLIYNLVGSVPKEGQRVRWHELEFEVDKVEGQRIKSLRVWR